MHRGIGQTDIVERAGASAEAHVRRSGSALSGQCICSSLLAAPEFGLYAASYPRGLAIYYRCIIRA